jgi:hypothetical protein
MISLTRELVRGTEEHSFISQPQLTLCHKIKELFLRETSKHVKQLTLKEIIFKNASK